MIVDRRTVLTGTAAALIPTRIWSATGEPIVQTTLGRVRGARHAGVNLFRGIRYGLAQRFGAPGFPQRASGIIDALEFGPSAPQRDNKYHPQAEDCLFLNVWTPEPRRGAKLPVMVYFHGGAYSSGSVVDPLNDGRHLAARDVVVVTVNHRLNVLGYLYLARLDPRFPDSGNLGQLDLVLALNGSARISRHSAAIRRG